MPMTYSEEERTRIKERVLDGLAKGTPLAVLCREDGMPDPATVWRWSEDEGEEVFVQGIARARDLGYDALAAECLEIADDGTNDYVEKKRQDGSTEEVLNHEHVSRSKLRVETRLKLLAKWDPKRYGDKTLIGSDPDNPLPAGFDVRLHGPHSG